MWHQLYQRLSQGPSQHIISGKLTTHMQAVSHNISTVPLINSTLTESKFTRAQYIVWSWLHSSYVSNRDKKLTLPSWCSTDSSLRWPCDVRSRDFFSRTLSSPDVTLSSLNRTDLFSDFRSTAFFGDLPGSLTQTLLEQQHDNKKPHMGWLLPLTRQFCLSLLATDTHALTCGLCMLFILTSLLHMSNLPDWTQTDQLELSSYHTNV